MIGEGGNAYNQKVLFFMMSFLLSRRPLHVAAGVEMTQIANAKTLAGRNLR